MKTIIINKGDEYRAKVELARQEESIFYDVYLRAEKCVEEIRQDARKYCDNLECGKIKDELFRSYGNNIVAFCGDRGAGKTSAMVSFAGQLKNDPKVVVLEPIDPTMLTDETSFILVFLSYLFKGFEKWYEKKEFCDERQLLTAREDLMECFYTCYRNLGYVQGKITREMEEDELENLAQLGDSTELRKNLYKLVDLYLSNVGSTKGCKAECLIIQVDDTDLAVNDAFKICEDIRKFLKFPKLIVFMAMDYEAMKRAVSEKNIELYEKSIHNQMMEAKQILPKMTARYLEKIFPKGNRIDLPRLDLMMTSYPGGLKLEYHMDEHDEIDKIFSGCHDLQEQLIKLLYERTGIILLKKSQNIHYFLPHTMRELTHFVKMLCDMKAVQMNAVFTGTNAVSQADRDNLKNNLTILREYFLENWCSSYLESIECDLMHRLDLESQMRNFIGLNRILSTYIQKQLKGKSLTKGRITYRMILKEVVDTAFVDNLDMQNAIRMYYTIFLNEWFVDAAIDPARYEPLIEFLEYPIEIPEQLRKKKYRGKYNIMHFTIPMEKIEKNIPETILNQSTDRVTWLKACCRAEGNESQHRIMESYRDGEDSELKWLWKEGVKEIQFDVLQPMLYAILDAEERSKLSQAVDSERECVTSSVGNEIIQDQEMSQDTFLSIKNIVANYELQSFITEKLTQTYNAFHRRTADRAWIDLLLEFYRNIDRFCQKELEFLHFKSACWHLEVLLKSCDLVLPEVFLSNEDNMAAYIAEYARNLLGRVEEYRQVMQDYQNAQWIDEVRSIFYDKLRGLISLSNQDIAPKIIAVSDVHDSHGTILQLKEQEIKLNEKCTMFFEELESSLDMKAKIRTLIKFLDGTKTNLEKIANGN